MLQLLFAFDCWIISCQICAVLWAGAVLLGGRGLALFESLGTIGTLGILKCVWSGLSWQHQSA